MIKTPSKEESPNWKIRLFIKWLNYQCPRAWQLGCSVAVNEMAMPFKGYHRDKIHITYKAEGDGFQADDLCADSYCYKVYMRNDRALKKYLKQGISPLHSWTMALFDSLKDDYHQVGMDNIYNSVSFCISAYHHDPKVLYHGRSRKAVRGITKYVLQDEENNPVAQQAARGTFKADILEGDPGCSNIIVYSVYATKPVHYLSMVSK